MGTSLVEGDVRTVARHLWAAQDAFLAGGRPPLHAQRELEVFTTAGIAPKALAIRRPAAGRRLITRTVVLSAETWTWRPHGTVTELVVETTLVDPGGVRLAVGRATVVLGPDPWCAALASWPIGAAASHRP